MLKELRKIISKNAGITVKRTRNYKQNQSKLDNSTAEIKPTL